MYDIMHGSSTSATQTNHSLSTTICGRAPRPKRRIPMPADTQRRPRTAPRPYRPATAPENKFTPLLPEAMHTLQEDEALTIDLETLPPLTFELYPNSSSRGSGGSLHGSDAGYDWGTFIHAYAAGRWDPHRTPRPPRPSPPGELPTEVKGSIPQGALAFERPRPPPPQPSHRLRAFPASYPPPTEYPAASTSASVSSAAASNTSSAQTHLDAQTSAATLRWAGARVRVAPLALPSPEHELVDPMRRAGA
ncbi:hypothetical protein FB451DRAFT_1144211, partial [Mycena latifolia]